MKRFFCTVCKKVKRTRQWPTVLENADSTQAEKRVGECNSHAHPYARRTPREYKVISTTLQTVGSRANRKARGN